LQVCLQRGERKLQAWFARHRPLTVDFSDQPRIFANINTPDQLLELEQMLRDQSGPTHL
jgi:molybdopterin-guanine dinucleotide biosynthesis protein A